MKDKTDIELEYDKPIMVSCIQYNYLMLNFSGVVAGRTDGENYYIKVWLMKCANLIKKYLSHENRH